MENIRYEPGAPGKVLAVSERETCGQMDRNLRWRLLNPEKVRANNLHYNAKFGFKGSTYNSWNMMKQRCLNPKSTSYPRYGALGIKVCDRWLKFANFLEDMGERPEGTTLDRIDSCGNYEPSNCRWATTKVQNSNRKWGHARNC